MKEIITRKCELCSSPFTVANERSRRRFCTNACRSKAHRDADKPEAAAPTTPVAPTGISLVEAVGMKLERMAREVGALEVYLLHLAALLDNPADLAGGALSSVGREFRATYSVVLSEADDAALDATDIAQAAVAKKRAELHRLRMAEQN